jgi:phytoene dehydrogenase-like protein
VVVGSGPNGLAAAVTCARAGLRVQVVEAQRTAGGGARTLDLGLADGVRHDLCSAVHPMAVASPFFREFDLAARGVDVLHPEVVYAHPLDGGRAGVAYRSLERTADGLGPDGRAWSGLLGHFVEHPDALVATALGDRHRLLYSRDAAGACDLLRVVAPTATRFLRAMLEQGGPGWGLRFRGDVAPALLTGVAAHANTSLPSLSAAGTALLLAGLAHSSGWPLVRGGSQAITDALLADLHAHGGVLVTGVEVEDLDQLPRARAYLFDTTPRGLVRALGERLPVALARRLTRFPYGNGVAKVDFVLSGPVPWTHPDVGRAGTVHLGGSRGQVAEAEAAVAARRHAPRPVVLVSDPTTVDPSRLGARGLRPLWAYAHVPAGSGRDLTEPVTAQIERFAPGFRDVVVTSRCIPAAQLSQHDANYPGGDIAAGSTSLYRMLARPRPARDPYACGLPGVYLCSASTPPGPGVHGLAGWYAARRVLRSRFGITEMPSLAPPGGLSGPPPSR